MSLFKCFFLRLFTLQTKLSLCTKANFLFDKYSLVYDLSVLPLFQNKKKENIFLLCLNKEYRIHTRCQYSHLLYISTSGFHSLLGVILRSLTPPQSLSFHLRLQSFHSCHIINTIRDIAVNTHTCEQKYWSISDSKIIAKKNVIKNIIVISI